MQNRKILDLDGVLNEINLLETKAKKIEGEHHFGSDIMGFLETASKYLSLYAEHNGDYDKLDDTVKALSLQGIESTKLDCIEQAEDLTLISIDMDNLTGANELSNHLGGTLVATLLNRILYNHILKENGIMAQSGEEFLAVVPTSVLNASKIVNQALIEYSSYGFSLFSSDVFCLSGTAGITSVKSISSYSLTELIEIANDVSEEGKKIRRGRVYIQTSPNFNLRFKDTPELGNLENWKEGMYTFAPGEQPNPIEIEENGNAIFYIDQEKNEQGVPDVIRQRKFIRNISSDKDLGIWYSREARKDAEAKGIHLPHEYLNPEKLTYFRRPNNKELYLSYEKISERSEILLDSLIKIVSELKSEKVFKANLTVGEYGPHYFPSDVEHYQALCIDQGPLSKLYQIPGVSRLVNNSNIIDINLPGRNVIPLFAFDTHFYPITDGPKRIGSFFYLDDEIKKAVHKEVIEYVKDLGIEMVTTRDSILPFS